MEKTLNMQNKKTKLETKINHFQGKKGIGGKERIDNTYLLSANSNGSTKEKCQLKLWQGGEIFESYEEY